MTANGTLDLDFTLPIPSKKYLDGFDRNKKINQLQPFYSVWYLESICIVILLRWSWRWCSISKSSWPYISYTVTSAYWYSAIESGYPYTGKLIKASISCQNSSIPLLVAHVSNRQRLTYYMICTTNIIQKLWNLSIRRTKFFRRQR